ncbi:MAG: hypothetical protein HUU60_07645 [Armatimonadetes bacterium]|nr:hypothetical protein [Armatimonadota bacterium]
MKANANPLWFLTKRLFKNSLARTFGNPARAGIVLLLIGLFVLSFGGSLLGTYFSGKAPPTPVQPVMPPIAASIALMMALHLIMLINAATPAFSRSQIAIFTESDVNYVFTSPLKPLSVIRFFLLIRGLLGSLFFMVLILFYFLIFGRANVRMMSSMVEVQAPAWAMAIYPLLYIAISCALLLTGLNIAVRAYRDDRIWRRVIAIGLFFVGSVSAYLSYMGSLNTVGGFWSGVVRALDAPIMHWVLFPLRAPAEAAVILYNGFTPTLFAGIAFWVALVWLLDRALLAKREDLYEFAAVAAAHGSNVRSAQSNPLRLYYDKLSEKAGAGDFRIINPKWMQRWRPTGHWALLWRDLLISFRMSGRAAYWVPAVAAVLAIGGALVGRAMLAPGHQKAALSGFGVAQYILIILFLIGSIYALMDLLKRMDMQKPLPLSAKWVVIVETVGSLSSIVLLEAIFAVAAIIFQPAWTGYVLYALVAGLATLFPVFLALTLLLLMNPDQTDFTQRAIVGILMMPLIALAAGPAVGVAALLFFVKAPLLLNLLVVMVLNGLISMVLVSAAAEHYENFNPTD